MKDLIEAIAKSLVDDEDAVEVSEVAGSSSLIIELRVAKGDLGKVIGRHGRTAGAMRTLVACIAAKGNKKCMLQIVEE